MQSTQTSSSLDISFFDKIDFPTLSFIDAWNQVDTNNKKIIPHIHAQNYALANAVHESLITENNLYPHITAKWTDAIKRNNNFLDTCMERGVERQILTPHNHFTPIDCSYEIRSVVLNHQKTAIESLNPELYTYLLETKQEYLAWINNIHSIIKRNH